ncbi:unnamed protein product [Strongylus vulgaris]|uniref:Coiled-coil domain-containing protein 22 homolog n=1 Tax=Strongylus vulgaris TaxID=40348 RepID=A0A3P7IWS6_STRVU|nr:unnamed protein product [Strongylus vulgaris]
MDELDQQIIQVFHELDCTFWHPDLTSLEELSPDDNIEFLIRCLWLISPISKTTITSYKLPPSILQRFHAVTYLADSFKENNVRGDFGYQTLLYGSTAELRQVFIAVIEKLPKNASPHAGENFSQLSFDPDSAWIPEFCRRLRMRRQGRLWFPPENEPDIFALFSRRFLYEALVADQSKSGFANLVSAARPKPPVPVKPSGLGKPVPTEKPTELELDPLEARLAEILQGIAEKQEMLSQIEDSIADLQQSNSKIKEDLDPNTEKLMVFLEDPDLMKSKILAFIKDGDARLEKMEAEFRVSREKLFRDLEELRKQQSQQSLLSNEQIMKNRGKLEEIRKDIEQNNTLAGKLESRLEQMKKTDVDRASMIRRIMEMTASIHKQDQEIHKVIHENLGVQRELKWLTQTLHRTFNLIEEALYKDTDDPKGERAYKLFGKLHSTCMISVEAIEQNGALSRQNEQLVDLIEIERQRQFEQQLSRIQADLDIIEKENARLERLLEESQT